MHLLAPSAARVRPPADPAPARAHGGSDTAGCWRGPLSGTLDALAPHLPPALVPAEALGRVRAVAAGLPAALTDELYLECRLAAGDARVDLVAHLQEGGMELAAGRNPGVDLPPRLLALPAWSRLRRFCGEWGRPRSALRRGVAAMWLEVDVHGAADDAHAPGLFLDVRWLAEPATPAEEWSALAGMWLEWVGGAPLPVGVLWSLRRCVRALPPGARMMYVGLFPGRGGAQVRACAAGVAPDALPGFLEGAGWSGDCAQMRELVRDLAPLARPGVVHLDVGAGGVAPRLGWELKLDRRAQLSGEIREQALLDRLVRVGLADASRAGALGEWPGWTIETLPHQLWESVLARRVNHVKVVLEPDDEPRAKAYLCARHAPRHPRSAPRARRNLPGGEP